jgi:nucleotide-binding universal stress UspA family protein
MPDSDQELGLGRWAHPARILVATNLSDLDRLMPFALQQAKETGARLILLHVLPASATIPMEGGAMPYYDPSGALEFAAKSLQPRCSLASEQNIRCDVLVREGNPAREIAAASLQFHVDRVLLGTRSRSKLGKLFLGSIAEQVLRAVPFPVMTVGPDARPQLESDRPQRVVIHATSLRESSGNSAALACHIAATQGAMLLLLHVLPPLEEPPLAGHGRSGQPASLDSAALHELHILAAQAGSGCCTAVESHVVHGNPAIEILAEASERGASLIVMGGSDRTAFEKLTRDRTIYRVLAHARCPVLTLRDARTLSAAYSINTAASFLHADENKKETTP